MQRLIKAIQVLLVVLCTGALPSNSAWAQPAGSAVVAADPAVWGVYSRLLGKAWESPGRYTISYDWVVPGESIIETWTSGTGTVQGTVTVTPGQRPGELQAKSSPLPMTWTGRIVDAGTIVFERSSMPKLPYRVHYADGGFVHERVKLANGAVVSSSDSARYELSAADKAREAAREEAQRRTALEAEAAAWGAYAGLIGQRWRLDIGSRPRVFEFSWIEPGQRMLVDETHLDDGSAFSKTTITRTGVPGELLVVNERKGLKTSRMARVQADGSLLFPKEGALKPTMRIARRDGDAWVEQQLKADSSVRMEYVYTALAPAPGARATAVASTTGVAQPLVAAAVVPAKPPSGGASGPVATASATGLAPGSHPVRVISESGSISSTFGPGVAGIDRQGKRYDCYLLQTQPGDRWEITVEADDMSMSEVVPAYLGLVHGPDCMAGLQQLAGTTRKEALLTYKQVHSMTAGGGYYWFVPVGIPGRSYTLQFKRKPGKPGGGMVAAGAASVPAPLIAVNSGAVAPVFEDPAWRKERVTAVQAIMARLDGRMLRTDYKWHGPSERAYMEWKQYLWDGKEGVLRIVNGQVNSTGVGQDAEMVEYRLDPGSQVYRTQGGKADAEYLPLDADRLLHIVYGRDERNRRTRTSATSIRLNPDGSQNYDAVQLYVPTDRVALEKLVPELGARQLARRNQLARDRAIAAQKLAEQEAQEQASGGSGFGRMLGTLAIATVGAVAVGANGGSAEQIMGGALVGATIANPDSAAASMLGSVGQGLVTGDVAGAGAASGLSSLAAGGSSYPTRPNLAISACAGFTESNYRQKAVSGGGDQQLYAMCGQAFEYYTMYKRAIAQGYSEADANRTYAAHQQSAEVASGYLQSHGAD